MSATGISRLVASLAGFTLVPYCVVFDTGGSNVWYDPNPPFYGNKTTRLRQDFTLAQRDGQTIHGQQLAGAFISPSDEKRCVARARMGCNVTDKMWCYENVVRPTCLKSLKTSGALPESVIGLEYDPTIFKQYGSLPGKLKVCGSQALLTLIIVQGRFAFRLLPSKSMNIDLSLVVSIKEVIKLIDNPLVTTRHAYIRTVYQSGNPIVALLSRNQHEPFGLYDTSNHVLEQVFSLFTTCFNCLDDTTVHILTGSVGLCTLITLAYDRLIVRMAIHRKLPISWIWYPVEVIFRAFYSAVMIIFTKLDFPMPRAAWRRHPVVARLRRRFGLSVPWLSVGTILTMCSFLQMLVGGDLKSGFTLIIYFIFDTLEKVFSSVGINRRVGSIVVLQGFYDKLKALLAGLTETERQNSEMKMIEFIIQNAEIVQDADDLVERFQQPNTIVATYPFSCSMILFMSGFEKFKPAHCLKVMRQNWFSIMTRIRLGTIYNQRIESLLSLPKELGLINHLWSERRAESILSDVQPKSIDQSIDGWEQITVYTITPLMTSVAIMFGSFVFERAPSRGLLD